MSNAAATLVGQNLGAGHPDRAEQAVWRTAFYNVIAGRGGRSSWSGPTHAGICSSTIRPCGLAARAACASWRPASSSMPYGHGGAPSAFNGAGDTRTPTLINFFCFWVFEIPRGLAAVPPGRLGPTGVFVAITVAFCSVAVISVALFRQGHWKKIKV